MLRCWFSVPQPEAFEEVLPQSATRAVSVLFDGSAGWSPVRGRRCASGIRRTEVCAACRHGARARALRHEVASYHIAFFDIARGVRAVNCRVFSPVFARGVAPRLLP